MDSSPTPSAIIVDSYDGFISSTKDKGIVKDLQVIKRTTTQFFVKYKKSEIEGFH